MIPGHDIFRLRASDGDGVRACGWCGAARWRLHAVGGLARRGGQPLLHLDLFRQRTFAAGLLISMAIFVYFGSFMLGLALFLQSGLHFSALDAGLTFAPVGIAFAATSLLTRPLIARHGARIIGYGLASTIVGLVGTLITVHASGGAVDSLRLLPWLIFTGAGNG